MLGNELTIYGTELQKILGDIIEQVNIGVMNTLCAGEDGGEVNINFTVPEIRRFEDLDFTVVLSFMRDLAEPVLVFRVFYSYSELDEFEAIGDDTPKASTRKISDFSGAKFFKENTGFKAKIAEFYYLSVKSWARYNRDYFERSNPNGRNFIRKEYQIEGHPRFKLHYYQIKEFEGLLWKESKLFMNESMIDIKKSFSNLPLSEDLASISQIENKVSNKISTIQSFISKENKMSVENNFQKKPRAAKAEGGTSNAPMKAHLKIEDECFKRIYTKVDDLSFILYEMETNSGSVMGSKIMQKSRLPIQERFVESVIENSNELDEYDDEAQDIEESELLNCDNDLPMESYIEDMYSRVFPTVPIESSSSVINPSNVDVSMTFVSYLGVNDPLTEENMGLK